MACGDVPRCGYCGGRADRWHQCYGQFRLVPNYGIALTKRNAQQNALRPQSENNFIA